MLLMGTRIPGWVRSSYGTLTPDIAIDFSQSRFWTKASGNGAIGDFFSMTRASSKFGTSRAGALTSFTNNAFAITDKGLLLEPAGTNLCIRSQDLENAAWTDTNISALGTAGTAPDGTATTTLVSPYLGAVEHALISTGITATATTHQFSIYAKPGTYNFLNFVIVTGAAGGTRVSRVFNLTTGEITQTGTQGSPGAVTNYTEVFPNGWVRIVLRYTPTTDANQTLMTLCPTPTGTPAVGANLNYTGNESGTGDCELWGAQIEASSFPTSYVPTVAASATRAADVVAHVGATSPLITQFNATEGTLYTNVEILNNSTTGRFAQWHDGTDNEQIRMAAGPTWQGVDGGVAQWSSILGSEVGKEYTRGAGRYRVNDIRGAGSVYDFVNSAYNFSPALAAADTSATLPTVTSFSLGSNRGTNTFMGGYFRQLAYWRVGLADSSLLSLVGG
jgi:hypothetical protein